MRASLHDLAVHLRSAFLREDGRQSGTIPRFLLPSCLRSGGFELSPLEVTQCYELFAGNDGRFNWVRLSHRAPRCILKRIGLCAPLSTQQCMDSACTALSVCSPQVHFCDDIESARSIAWARLKRVPFEGTFRGMQSQDTRGYVHRQELAEKTKQWKCVCASLVYLHVHRSPSEHRQRSYASIASCAHLLVRTVHHLCLLARLCILCSATPSNHDPHLLITF